MTLQYWSEYPSLLMAQGAHALGDTFLGVRLYLLTPHAFALQREFLMRPYRDIPAAPQSRQQAYLDSPRMLA